jgi:4-aminobutyrate aminotransferase-like enzyme
VDDSRTDPPTMINAFDASSLEHLEPAVRELVSRRQRVLGPGYRLMYDKPLELVRGLGTRVYDANGTEYLDMYNNVPSLGHCHPRVVAAMALQMNTLNTNTRYVQKSLVDYAEQLVATFPSHLTRATFTCTGSEANDLALRIARHETGQEGVVVTASAYHGLTDAVASISPSLGPKSALGPHVRVVEAPDALRSDTDLTTAMRLRTRSAIADLARHGFGLCAFVADSIFSSDGIFADPPGFLTGVVDEVHAAGGLYVADEVQPGFGRTGDSWWGFERHAVQPDIVSIGKPMGNGMPIAGLVLKEGVGDSFGEDIRYFNTFGGNSVSIAAAQAVLDVIRDDDLVTNSHDMGRALIDGLRDLLKQSDNVAEVRGAGLFMGVDLVTDRNSLEPHPELASAVVNNLRDNGVLISASGPRGNVLKIRPPLIFDSTDLDQFLTTFAEVASSTRVTR